jgi:RHS repeat-associated protein
LEKYNYDPAGNILSKSVARTGNKLETTHYTYDKANQLATSVEDGKQCLFKYDAAGRLISEKTDESGKTYDYGWLDKVMSVARTGNKSPDGSGKKTNYEYYADGQLCTITNDKQEKLYWNGLALARRGDTDYTIKPAVTGGNPVTAENKVMFNDLLGNTLGFFDKSSGKFREFKTTAFGEVLESPKSKMPAEALRFFTGKPKIEGLGYNFLFRNYRAELGKWQTIDPLGYPDGWNNLAYCNNKVLTYIDFLGGYEIEWDGSWTASEKTRVTDSFARVKQRMNTVIGQVVLEIARVGTTGDMTNPATQELMSNLIMVKDGLQETVNNIDSSTYNLEIYKADLGGDYANYWPSPVPYYDDELTFDYGWFSNPTVDDGSVFHETTHTWSDDGESGNDFKNAYRLEHLQYTDFRTWTVYTYAYKDAFGEYPE